jgi:dephospho-CoA kinase
LIRRHPHVFGENKTDTADQALQRWEKEKAKEKASQLDSSILEGVPRGLPALQKAARILEKVTKVGFQWKDLEGPLHKVDEELQELKAEIQELDRNPEVIKKVEMELGDLLFTISNLAYLLKINPETALRGTLVKFDKRFRYVEKKLKERGKLPEQSDLQEMDALWNEAKKIESVQVWGLTGGIASGKSTVAQIIAQEFGVPIVDADALSKKIVETDSEIQKEILHLFGTLDRSQIREKVFQDNEARKALESLLHPRIQKESRKLIEDLALQHPIIIYEATLLIETGRHQELTGLIVVEASEETRIQRLHSRNQFNREQAEKIMASQARDADRKPHASFVIENNGNLEQLRSEIKKLPIFNLKSEI